MQDFLAFQLEKSKSLSVKIKVNKYSGNRGLEH